MRSQGETCTFIPNLNQDGLVPGNKLRGKVPCSILFRSQAVETLAILMVIKVFPLTCYHQKGNMVYFFALCLSNVLFLHGDFEKHTCTVELVKHKKQNKPNIVTG